MHRLSLALAATLAFGAALPSAAAADEWVEVTSDNALASDVLTSDLTVWSVTSAAGLDLDVTAYGSVISIDYQPAPADFFTDPATRTELRYGGALQVSRRLSADWTVRAGGGGYSGFTDYRSVWLAEHWRQKFRGFEAYVAPEPAGYFGQLGAQYRAGTLGLWEAAARWASDEVVPAWERGPAGRFTSSAKRLNSTVLSLTWDATPHPRLQTRLGFEWFDQTSRGNRFGGIAEAHWIPAEGWMLKAVGRVTSEEPDFQSASLLLEALRQLHPGLQVAIFVRGYEDNGQVTFGLPESTASPALQTLHTGLRVRQTLGNWTWSIAAGPYWNDYEQRDDVFDVLFRDRSWVLITAGIHCSL